MKRALIVGISGKRGSGKDTAADFLIRKYDFARVSFADPMKEFCLEVFGFTLDQMYGPSANRESVDNRWGITPRHALQTLGTEWGRSMHPDLWVRYAMRTAHQILKNDQAPGVVITDLRFPNEAKCIKDGGGLLVRIKRPGGHKDEASMHPSEIALDVIPDRDFDMVIDNAGTIGDLEIQMRALSVAA